MHSKFIASTLIKLQPSTISETHRLLRRHYLLLFPPVADACFRRRSLSPPPPPPYISIAIKESRNSASIAASMNLHGQLRNHPLLDGLNKHGEDSPLWLRRLDKPFTVAPKIFEWAGALSITTCLKGPCRPSQDTGRLTPSSSYH